MSDRSRKVFLLNAWIAVTSIVISGCAPAALDCTSFGKQFDQLQAATAADAALIVNRGVCHTQIEADRRAQCPEYYTWLATAKTFSAFVASEKSGCVTDVGRANARQDFADLERPDAFPVK